MVEWSRISVFSHLEMASVLKDINDNLSAIFYHNGGHRESTFTYRHASRARRNRSWVYETPTWETVTWENK